VLVKGGQLDRLSKLLVGFESNEKLFASPLELRQHVIMLNSIPSHHSFFPLFFLPTTLLATSSACFCHPSSSFAVLALKFSLLAAFISQLAPPSGLQIRMVSNYLSSPCLLNFQQTDQTTTCSCTFNVQLPSCSLRQLQVCWHLVSFAC